MSTTRKTLLVYGALWSASVLLAAGSTLWLGLDARVPVDMLADGTVTKSRSVAVLWLMPALATVLFGSMALGAWFEAWRARRRPPAELGEDAQRGLAAYGRAIRTVMTGFGLLLLALQLFGLLRASGIPAPLGLDREGMVRLLNLVAGALFAYIGNVTPRLPWLRRPGLDTAPFYRANRAVGWIFMLGGLGYILSALVWPFERMVAVNGWLVLGMLGFSAGFYLLAVIASARRVIRTGTPR
jgi:hypothetical protein